MRSPAVQTGGVTPRLHVLPVRSDKRGNIKLRVQYGALLNKIYQRVPEPACRVREDDVDNARVSMRLSFVSRTNVLRSSASGSERINVHEVDTTAFAAAYGTQ